MGDPLWGVRFGHVSLANEFILRKLIRAQLRLREVNIIPVLQGLRLTNEKLTLFCGPEERKAAEMLS